VTIDGYWIDNCIYGITVYTLQFTTVHTLYNSQQLSLFSSSEDFGSSSATTAATNSFGIPCHHYPGNSTELCTILTQSKSESHYDRWPVGQWVLVSSPVWGSWPDVNYCLTVTVLSVSGAPSDERSGLSFVLVTWTASVGRQRPAI
jgi:hypothetical protein